MRNRKDKIKLLQGFLQGHVNTDAFNTERIVLKRTYWPDRTLYSQSIGGKEKILTKQEFEKIRKQAESVTIVNRKIITGKSL